MSIYSFDEARNAGCAAEMLRKGEWIVPTFNEELRTLKPPLHYYFMMVSFKLGGFNPFAARLFSGLFGALTLVFVFWFSNTYFNRQVAWWSTLTLLASLHLNIQLHMAVPDPYMLFFMTVMFGLFFHFLQTKNPWHIYGMYVSMGACVLLKGPFAILLPGLIFLVHLILSKKLTFSTIKELRLLSGLVLGLAIVLPWNIAVGLATDWEWNKAFYLTQNVGRFTNTMEGHGGSFFLTFAFVLLGMLPFSVFIPQAFYKAWKHSAKGSLLNYCMILVSIFVVFFALSQTKLPNYTVPVYPFLGIILGWFLHHSIQIKKPKLWIPLIVNVLIAVAVPIAAYFAIGQEESIGHLQHLAFYLIIFPVGAFISLGYYYNKNVRAALLSIGVSAALMSWLFVAIVFPPIDQQNPVIQAFNKIDTTQEIAYLGFSNPAFVYELNRSIPVLENHIDLEYFFKEHPNGYVISRLRNFQSIDYSENWTIIFEQKDLFETARSIIIVPAERKLEVDTFHKK